MKIKKLMLTFRAQNVTQSIFELHFKGGNNFSGTIPTQIGYLSKLSVLNFGEKMIILFA